MIDLKNMSARRLVFNMLKKVPAILGCLLFLFSFILPFYYNYWVTANGGTQTYYWSYKSEYQYSPFAEHGGLRQYWFSDSWFSPYLNAGFGLPWIIIPMFAIQSLTMVFSIASVFVNRRILWFAPVLSCWTVMALMIYTGMASSGQYQEGFYLTYPSVAVFMVASLLNEVTKRRQ